MSRAAVHADRDWPIAARPNRRGMVLVIVVVVVVMLSLAGLSFVANMHTENRAARVQGRRLQLECAVGSGAELLKAFCQRSWEEQQEAGGTWDNTDRFRAQSVVDDESAQRRLGFSIVWPKAEDGESGGVRFGAENESAKLNLGTLLRWETRAPGSGRSALMNLPGMTDSIADALLDWIDPDDTPRSFGAEADAYRDLGVPYGPRNGIPQCLEELLLVRGVTRQLLLGEANRGQRAGAGDRLATPWASLLTVASAERNETLRGQPRINVNVPNLQALHQQLAAALDRSWADFIVLYRQYGPYRGSHAASATQPTLDLSRPARRNVVSLLDLVGAKVLQGSDERKGTVVASPLEADSAELRDKLPLLLDALTVTPAKVIDGKINVNLAPRPVLLAVPGMDAALVDRILVTRGSPGSREDSQRHFPTWLLTEGLVDLPTMKRLLPYLTGGGDVVRAKIIGYDEEKRHSLAVELVIDAASSPARQIYEMELPARGGYSLESLGVERRESSRQPASWRGRRAAG